MAKAKIMTRSRNQLATAYAPESFFTFEGGLGACISRGAAGESIELSDSTKELIFQRMNELCRGWFDQAMAARESAPSKPPVDPAQCLDEVLLDHARTGFRLPGEDRFYLCRPSNMEYTPAPLTFVCRNCGQFRDFRSLKQLAQDLEDMSRENCPSGRGSCDWEQLDVIFVHWSGHWEPAFPGQWHWDERSLKVVQRRDNCVCGSASFRLNRKSSAIGEWFFECSKCGKPLSRKWLQNDPDTLRVIGERMQPERLTEVRMQATSYRASSVYYVKSDLFIDFKDNPRLLGRLRPGREDELQDFLATEYGFASAPITDADVKAACAGKPECTKDLADYLSAVDRINTAEPVLATLTGHTREVFKTLLDEAHQNRRRIIEDLRRRGILVPKIDLPIGVVANLRQRQSRYASRFDPFRLAVEHATLKTSRLEVEKKTNGKKPYVSFTRLDEDLSPEDPKDTETQERFSRQLIGQLGLDDLGLIRGFDLCRFSFGYSRMESTPVLREKRGMNMPVRLRLFPPVKHDDSQRRPIYVVQQSNEALYARLRPDRVLGWLRSLECPDMFEPRPGERLGAGIFEIALPMGPFLDKLPHSTEPPAYLYIYTLLHSLSHLLIKQVSEYSGLDLGSLGEYIFPADLAFVVYRNGTTMDLGNLSAMWRNSGTAMLSSMLSPKATQCGTGSLCTHRGGACPDCLMIPETSCIAGNKLLSRSVLRSVGGRPRFDLREGSIGGFLDSLKS